MSSKWLNLKSKFLSLELTGLKIEFQIRDEKVVVESPMGVNIPAGTPHTQRIIEGSGHFFNFVPKSNYNDGLL